MKKTASLILLIAFMCSCKKEQNTTINAPVTDPFALPWNTKNISYSNIQYMCGSHSWGYNVFYKDSLIRSKCTVYGGVVIADSMMIDDSQLLLYTRYPADMNSSVIHTIDGGLNWEETYTGMYDLFKFHFVKKELIYCFTGWKGVKYLRVTGIGKSNLKIYGDSVTIGRHYINDFGTNILNIDSTVVPLNDSVTFVIKFK